MEGGNSGGLVAGGRGKKRARAMAYFPKCLLLYADNLAVQGDMMVSEGEMYVCCALFASPEHMSAV